VHDPDYFVKDVHEPDSLQYSIFMSLIAILPTKY
jgi:hypothetical protein